MNFNLVSNYEKLPHVFYSKVKPEQVSKPTLQVLNEQLLLDLNIFSDVLQIEASQPNLTKILSGQHLLKQGSYISMAYAGHQFGYPGMLGDGRAILIGEQVVDQGSYYDIQLKGSGQTPYSRAGDGKAALAPMLREYLISEAMHALGIPTSRSLAVVTTGEDVFRETVLPGAILTRVAQSHIRVGTFEFAYLQNDPEVLQALLKHSVERHFPELVDSKNLALVFLQAVMNKQLNLMLEWMRVGFVHGVMNTDNMTISGESIDYGPCAFMDAFHMDTVFSSIDQGRRYAFGQQPNIAQWNLSVLAQCLSPLLAKDSQEAYNIAKEQIEHFLPSFEKKWLSMMKRKLGLYSEHKDDLHLMKDLLTWMQKNKVDYTYTFYCLMQNSLPSSEHACDKVYEHPEFKRWYQGWKQRLTLEQYSEAEALKSMQSYNPTIIPRNYKVEEALLKAQNENDYSLFKAMLEHLSKPYEEQNNCEYLTRPPKPNDQDYVTYCGT
ncbi:YdiU family protein [bacterium]|nr:YdiU family protein [bacterium]